MKKTTLLAFLLCSLHLLGAAPPPGSGHFALSPAFRDGYQKALSLRFGEARTALSRMQQTEPHNLLSVLLENYLDFLHLYLGDQPDDFKPLSRKMAPRLQRIANSGDRTSPWYRYCQAEIRLQWAILHGRNQDYLSSLSDIKQAYALLEENRRLYPDFIANLKSLGVMHALAGNVPDEYKWAVRLLGGMSGSTDQGLRELEAVMDYARHQDFVFETEATVMYALLQLHLNNQGEVAWKALKNSKLNPASDPMAAYMLASVAMRTGRNDEAIQYLRQCPSGSQYPPFIARYYLLGLAKLRRLDADAHQPIEHYLWQWKSRTGIKEAYQKLAWQHLLQDDESAYRSTMSQVKQNGSAKTEGDQAAQREATQGILPDRRLLRARLLFDGGYYLRAYETLKNTAVQYAADPQHHLEYTYRMGRILQKLGKTDEAQRHYQKTIERGASAKTYFACNAALQLGLLYEERKQPQKACEAYRQCLRLHPDEYAGSLHTQAKARLSRLQ